MDYIIIYIIIYEMMDYKDLKNIYEMMDYKDKTNIYIYI